MNILLIAMIIWIIYDFCSTVKKEKMRGVAQFIFIIIAAFLAASGDKFGFNGGKAALLLGVLFLIGMIIYDKRKKSKEDRK